MVEERAKTSIEHVTRHRFRRVFDEHLVGNGFFEGADYYRYFWDRYWNTFQYIERLGIPPAGRVLDIGSGQFALLAKLLLGVEAEVADIDTRYTDVLESHGIELSYLDLSTEALPPGPRFDLVILSEVIEHVPRPPYLVFGELAATLKPGGRLLVTTPNLYRLRNLVRMARGAKIFDYYRVPEKDAPLGHFVEYAQDQIEWHFEEAGFEVELSTLVQLTLGGASAKARWARRMLAPLLRVRPLWRDNLLVIGRKVR